MTNDPNRRLEPPPLSFGNASRLLAEGLSEDHGPAGRLLARVSEPDGGTWLASVLAEAAGDRDNGLDPPTLDQLVAIKERTKGDAHPSDDDDRRLGLLAAYLLAVAAALAHHQTVISSRPEDELEAIFVELAALAPPPWRDLFLDGAAEVSRRSRGPGTNA